MSDGVNSKKEIRDEEGVNLACLTATNSLPSQFSPFALRAVILNSSSMILETAPCKAAALYDLNSAIFRGPGRLLLNFPILLI